MSNELERATPQYRMLKGSHVIEDPTHSNLAIIGKNWSSVRARCEHHLNLILPEDCPVPPVSA